VCVCRLYRAADPSTALQEWRVGRPLGRGQLMDPAPAGDRRLLPLLAALGHTAVAFDFLPPVSRSSLRVRSNTDAATGDVSLFQPGDRAWGSSTPLPPRRAEVRHRLSEKLLHLNTMRIINYRISI
jgi:hypothetical protein